MNGAGVFYGGPASEAPALSGKDAYIAGGGNSAGQAALHLARYARRVTLVVRAASLEAGMSHYLVREIEATPNVEVRTGTDGGRRRRRRPSAAAGAARARHRRRGDGRRRRPLRADRGPPAHRLAARRDRARPARVPAHRRGRFRTTTSWPLERRPFALETSMPGVLAAGDVRHASVKRVASAVGEGSIAVQLVHSLLADDRRAGRGRPARSSSAGECRGSLAMSGRDLPE